MKLIIFFLILFLILSITSEELLDAYSIEIFKNDLKLEGLLEIIESIKKIYSQDVAIISCEKLTGNRKGNCQKLVTQYLAPSPDITIGINYGSRTNQSWGNKPPKNIIKESCTKPEIKNILDQKYKNDKKIKYDI